MNNLYTYTDFSGFGEFAAIILSLFLAIFLVALIVMLIFSIFKWKVYKKAGQSGWAALIPIYSDYVGCQICGINTMWVWITLGALVISVLIPPLSFVGTLCSLYFRIIFSVSMARSFGRSDAFAVGLIFIPIVFYGILASNSSTYLGKKPMHDFILEMFDGKNSDNNINTNTSETNNNSYVNTNSTNTDNTSANKEHPKYCSFCGTALDSNTNFCPNCGHKI